jgi:adenylate cyclase
MAALPPEAATPEPARGATMPGAATPDAPTPAPVRGAFRLSYRLSLVVAIPLLVVATGGLIVGRTYGSTRAVVDALTRDLFREVSRQTVARTRAHVAAAVPAIELLDGLARGRAEAPAASDLLPQLEVVARANPGFSWVSYGDEAGSFAGVFRATDGALHSNESRIEDGKTRLRVLDLDAPGGPRVVRAEEDTGYDPRARPFYAAARARAGRVWLPPYVFYEQGVPGVTCARAHRGPGGALRGVFTVDFDLNALSEFVRSLALSPRGEVVLFTPERALLAHPRVRVVGREGSRAAGEILTLRDVDDPALRALDARLGAADLRLVGGARDALSTARRIAFEHDGEPWIGSVTPFVVDEGLVWAVAVLAPESDFLGGVQRESRISLAIGLTALLLSVVVALLLASRIARPLAELAGEMAEVGRFELRETPPRRTVFREIERMDGALRAMKNGLRSFARFVPRDVVRRVLASGGQARLGGETRVVTLFFSDLAGFTTMSEALAPTALVEQLGVYLDEMTRTITEGGGTVDKYIGDGIMAFWGAPETDEAHARRAAVTAVRCQERLAALAERPEHGWLARAETRIGLSTGEAVVGNVGTPERMNYTAMGDAVNLAARLEGLGKQYGVRVLAAESTYAAARDAVVGRAVDVVAVKGKSEGVRVYELRALRAGAPERELRVEALSARALDAYLARRFDEAATLWDEIGAVLGHDPVAAIMAQRARAYAGSPPPADWSGVQVATSK